jgi:hypothetical protein
MNVYFVRLKNLYDSGRATESTIKAAFNRGWLSSDEYKAIIKK